jgi:hypothetical protein
MGRSDPDDAVWSSAIGTKKALNPAVGKPKGSKPLEPWPEAADQPSEGLDGWRQGAERGSKKDELLQPIENQMR